jgi:hypothetical protein
LQQISLNEIRRRRPLKLQILLCTFIQSTASPQQVSEAQDPASAIAKAPAMPDSTQISSESKENAVCGESSKLRQRKTDSESPYLPFESSQNEDGRDLERRKTKKIQKKKKKKKKCTRIQSKRCDFFSCSNL